MIAPLHIVLFIVIFSVLRLQRFRYHAFLFIVQVLYPKVAMIAPLHIVLFIVILLFPDCNDSNTIYCVVHCTTIV